MIKNTSKLKFWPPNSPDLSSIENVWDLIQERIQGMEFSNLEELEQKNYYTNKKEFPQNIAKNYSINLLVI